MQKRRLKQSGNRVKDNKKNTTKGNKDNQNIRRFELKGLVFIIIGVLTIAGLAGLNVGFIGLKTAKVVSYGFGLGAFPAAIFFLLIGFHNIMKHQGINLDVRLYGIIGVFLSCLGFLHSFLVPEGKEILPESLLEGGGLIGGAILFVLRKFFGVDGAAIILVGLAIASLLLATSWSLAEGILKTKKQAVKGADVAKGAAVTVYDKGKQVGSFIQEQAQEQVKEVGTRLKGIREKSFLERYERDSAFLNEGTLEVNETGEQSVRREFTAAPHSAKELVGNNPLAADFFSETFVKKETTKEAEPRQELLPTREKAEDKDMPEVTSPLEINLDAEIEEFQEDKESSAYTKEDDLWDFPEQESFTEDSEQFEESYEEQEEVLPITEEESQTIDEAYGLKEMNITYEEERGKEEEAVAEEPSTTDEAKEIEVTEEISYQIPEISLLTKSLPKENHFLEKEINDNAKALSGTLNDFKVKATIVNACHGPSVTRYEVKPAPGVKVSKITSLSEDIALNLAATAVRIEQIPGKAAIGIEVPNKELESVGLRDVLENPAFNKAISRLTVGLGKDISGQPVFADLAKMPHLLVAGATGSGKSVCINTLISSILFKATPSEVKFILIDPKMVELSVYNDIPHLMVPVVTDARKAASVLNWAVQEMEKRYGLIAQMGVRNMEGYNRLFEDMPEKKLPSIVIIIDELADLMMVAPHDVEEAICRIAQKARAAGIYLVLATQRPSVNVITGVIKANIPSRISFAVTSQIDSRTILDAAGAEKLLGRGDMLFKPQEANKAIRIQGAFISDQEVEALTEYIKSQGQQVEINQELIDFTNRELESSEEDNIKAPKGKRDALLREAVELALSTNNASASCFQRRYNIGYSRAGRLIDTMEQLGIVGPPQGSKPREILMLPKEAMEALERYERS